MGFLTEDTTEQPSNTQGAGFLSGTSAPAVTESETPQAQPTGGFLSGASEVAKEFGQGMVEQVQSYKRSVGEFVEGLTTAKNVRMEGLFKDFQQGKISKQDYQKAVDEFDTPLWDVGSFLIGSMTGSRLFQAAPVAVQIAGIAMPVASIATADSPREAGAAFTNTAVMMAIGLTVGKYENMFWDKVTGLPGKFSGVKLNPPGVQRMQPQLEMEVNVAAPQTQVAMDLSKRTGSYTRQQKQLVGKLKAGVKQPKVVVDSDALSELSAKSAVMRNIDFTKAQTVDDLAKQLYVKQKPQQLDMFDENIVMTSAVAAKTLYGDPDFQAVKDLYNPANENRNFFKGQDVVAIDKETGMKVVLAQAGDAKAKFTRWISNSQTTAEVLGPQASKLHDQMIAIDKSRLTMKDAMLNNYMGRIAVQRGAEFKLPVKGDPLNLNQGERIELWIRLHNPKDVPLLPKKVFNPKVKSYYVDDVGNPNSFLTPAEVQQASTMLAAIRNTKGRTLEAGKIVTGRKVEDMGDYYIPRSYDRSEGLPGDVLDDFTMRMGSNMDGISLEESLIKSRTNVSQGTLKLDAYASFEKYINQSTRLIAVAEGGGKQVIDQIAVTSPHIAKNFGPETADMWKSQAKVWLAGETPVRAIGDRELQYLTRKGTGIAVSINPLKLAATQLGGLIPVLGKVGVKDTLKGIQMVNTPQGKAILAQDPHFMGRVIDPNLEKINLSSSFGRGKRDIVPKAMQKVGEVWTTPPRLLDMKVAGAAYLAGYVKSMRKFPGNIARAQLEATKVLSGTQGMSQAQFRPTIQQGSAVGKGFTAFQSQQFAQDNSMMRAYAQFKNGQIGKGELIGQYMTNIFLPAVYQSTVDLAATGIAASLGTGEAPDEEKVASSLVMGQAQQVAILGGWLSGMKYNNGKLNLPLTKPLELSWKAGTSLAGMFESEEYTTAMIRSLEAYAAIVYGVDYKIPADFAINMAGEGQ